MSTVDGISRQHNSKIHRLRCEWQRQCLMRRVVSSVLRKRYCGPQGLFFQFGNHRIFGNAKIAANIPYSTTVEGLLDNLLLDLRQPCSVKIFPLKAFSASVTPIALCAVFTMSIFDKIITLAAGTRDLNKLFHDQSRCGYCKRCFL